MPEPTKEERDGLLYEVRVGLQTKMAPLERDEQVDAVDAVFDVVPASAAGAVLDALNPASENWHPVALYFANEKVFSRAARGEALAELAQRAGRKAPTIRRIPHPGGRLEGDGKPRSKSRGTGSRTTARAAVGERGLDPRKEACKRTFAGDPPQWHESLLDELKKAGADKTATGVIAALERHVPDGGAPRLFARLCSRREAFGNWFGDPTNIPAKSRQAALDHLADEMGLPDPKKARKADRPATGAPKTPLRSIKDPINTKLTVDVITHGLNLSRFAKLQRALEAEEKLAYWTLSLRHGDPNLDRTRPNVSTAAAGGPDPLPWFKWEELDKAARAKGYSQSYFEKLIADFEREFATVMAGALRNVFAFYRKQLDAWRKRVTHGRLAELVVASAREQVLAVGGPVAPSFLKPRVQATSYYQVSPSVLSGLVRHRSVMDKLSDVLNAQRGPHRVEGVRKVLLTYIDARKSDVEDADEKLQEGAMRIYDRPQALRKDYAELFGIAPNTVAFDIIRVTRGPAGIRRVLLQAIGLALLLIPAGTVVRIVIAAVAAYEVATEVEEHEFDREIHRLGLLRKRPDLFWVALAIVGGFFEVSQGIAPAAKLVLRASQKVGEGASTIAVLLRAKKMAPTAAVRTHLDRAIAAQRAIDIAEAAKKSAKPPLNLAGLGAGTFLPPVRAPWTAERLRKFILAKMAGGVASVEQLIHSLRASSAFRKLSAADQKKLVKALSSEARTILRFGQQWSGRARSGVAKKIASGPLSRYGDLLSQFLDTHWDDAFYLATRRLASWRKGKRSASGARNALKGLFQEMLGDLQTVHKHHRQLASKSLPKGWSEPKFFRNVKDASGDLTDGIWMTRTESGLWVLLHVNEFKSKSNWRALYRKQIRRDIQRLRGTIEVDGKTLVFGKDFKIVSDVLPNKPLRFALAFPREMVGGTKARKTLLERANKVLQQENFPAKLLPVNSPLPPGPGRGKKGFDDLLAEAILDAVDTSM